MLVINLPFESLPQARLGDTVYHVLQFMSEYSVRELVVSDDDGTFIGLIDEDTLLGLDANMTIENTQHAIINVSVGEYEHFLKAVSVAVVAHISILPVINAENKLVGVVQTAHLLEEIANFMQLSEPGGLIVLEVDAEQYSFSEIGRLIEGNDAQLSQFNTTRDKETGKVLITLKVNKMEISDIVATFQRYEYHVKYYFGEELYANELKSNYENLMNYLNV